MSSSTSIVVVISAVLLLSFTATTISAFNITRILDEYPPFSQFNSLLSQTHLAEEINRRKTITILALTNDRLGDITGKPVEVQKRILMTHVVLDYYDVLKLNKLKSTKTVLTNLYQATGTADDQQGFLDVTHKNDGSIYFGSAMKGSPLDAKLEGSVMKMPYNISVLSISHPIIAPGIDGTYKLIGAPPPKAAAPGPKVPPPAESPEEDVPADAPVAEEPAADADAPAPVDGPAGAPGPDATPADAADNHSPPPANGAGKNMVSGVMMMVTLASFLAAH
ncbi:hypothetical protein DH2020_006044 [Rehmannia glutinosa]|uniref:FAS1 domain-containing protein n=1 Tax=Rehmannia glutinosa TaxID=99300 RepID=A0ABR0XHR2_REHGL